MYLGLLYGALEGSRTPDLSVRSRMLYPAELRALNSFKYYKLSLLLSQVYIINLLLGGK